MNLLATFETDGYQLDDVVERNRATPTFNIPPESARAKLPLHGAVKLVFLFPPNFLTENLRHPDAERMWVLYLGQDSAGRFLGELNNDPAFFGSDVLKCGDTVVFEPRHIASIALDKHGSIETYPPTVVH